MLINCKLGYENKNITQQIVTCGDDGNWLPKPVACTQICGKERAASSPNIIGGSPINISQAPWHVGIYQKNSDQSIPTHICSGTILNAKVVITAMH